LEIVLKPIGYVRTSLSDDEVRRRPGGVEAEVEVLKEFEEGLEGIEGFSHIIVVFYMHKAHGVEAPLKQRPRRLLSYGITLEELPLVGVFCLDSPHRPNPIGLTVVELLERRGRVLRVRGLDAFDGTPVLDLKPYVPACDAFAESACGWLAHKDLSAVRADERFGRRRPRRLS